jgi:hypothetical protein
VTASAEGGARERRATALTVVAGMLAALAVALAVWIRMDPLAFQGGDGKLFQTLILNHLRYGDWLQVNAVNPLQGAFSPQFPINTWLNPAYVVFRWLDWNPALPASLAVAFVALAVPTYLVGRAAGLGKVAAVVAAQTTVASFPPFAFLFGLNSQYSLVPPGAVTAGLQTLAVLVVLRQQSATVLETARSALLLAAVTSAALIVDPTWFLPSLVAIVPFVALAVLEGRCRSRVLARLAAVLGALLVLYLLGTLDFVASFVRYTARHVFDAEVARPQLPAEASMLFAHPVTFGKTLLWAAVGWGLGAALTRGARRLLAIGCIAHWSLVLALAAVYLFEGRIAMNLAPIYVEQAAYQLYIVGAISGWSALVERIGRAVTARSPRSTIPGTYGAVLGLLVVPALLAWYLIEAVPVNRSRYTEPWAEEDCLVDLSRAVALTADAPSRRFNGSVAILEGADGYRKIQTLARLWREGVPTVNEYSQLVTPLFHYVISRGARVTTANQVVLVADARMLALLGARFIVVPDTSRVTISGRRRDCGGRDVAGKPVRWSVVDVAEPNVGQYSPTHVHRARTAAEMLGVMLFSGVDFRDVAVLHPVVPVPRLTPARHVALSVRRGRLHVSAESDGDSLVVLPVQYSRCWRIVGDDSARLVRADLLLTGVLFTRRIDADLIHDFGFLSSACRAADHEDLASLSLGPEAPYRLADEERHPLAIRAVGEVRARVAALAQDMRARAEQDRVSPVLFHGPITEMLRRWFAH